MRRWLTAAALGGLMVTVLAGCTMPGGVDGNLTDDWKGVGEPKPFKPSAPACQSGPFSNTSSLATYNPVDCANDHRTEAVYVGEFTGEAANRSTRPSDGSTELRTAFTECDKQATDYVGADWRNGRLWLGVVLPSEAAWTGGARWYRCDLQEVDDIEDYGDFVNRKGSVKGVLASEGPLTLGCYVYASSTSDAFKPSACTATHNSEFAGLFAGGDIPYPATSDAKNRTFYINGCLGVIAKYAGVPNDTNMQYRTGLIWRPPTKEDWEAGNHSIRCYIWLDRRTVTASLKGAGNKGLPVS